MARILVVDDEKDLTDLLVGEFGRMGFKVDAAGSGGDGLALFGATAPDAVIVDNRLPDMEGTEVVRHIRAADPRVPLIMLTVDREEDLSFAPGLMRPEAVVHKPFVFSQLRDLVLAIMADARRRKR